MDGLDKAHTEYFKDAPAGNHVRMSPETEYAIKSIKETLLGIRQDFKEHSKMDEQKFGEILSKFGTTYSELEKQVVIVIEKVDGINRRLDITNGRIAANEQKTATNMSDIKLLMTEFSHVLSETNDIRRESKEEKNKRSTWFEWTIKGFLGFVLTVIGGLLYAALQKLEILNL